MYNWIKLVARSSCADFDQIWPSRLTLNSASLGDENPRHFAQSHLHPWPADLPVYRTRRALQLRRYDRLPYLFVFGVKMAKYSSNLRMALRKFNITLENEWAKWDLPLWLYRKSEISKSCSMSPIVKTRFTRPPAEVGHFSLLSLGND